MTGQVAVKSVFFESCGVILIIGDTERVMPVAEKLTGDLKVITVLSDTCPDTPVHAGINAISGIITELSGHLGTFSARGAVPGGTADIGSLSPNDSGFFDLVIDFSDPPLLSAEVPPYGYYAVARHKSLLQRALAEAPRLVGRFSKSKYFRYKHELCTHGSKGVEGCSRCLSSCPANAITSLGEQIHVDAFLCRGCGTCTLLCPTGALSYAHQDSVTPLQLLRDTLRQIRKSSDDPVHVVLHGSVIDAGKLEQWLQRAGEHTLPVACKVVASTGMETWLGILSLGNISLTLLVDGQLPSLSSSALQRELASTHELLQALGIDAGVITLCNVDETDMPESKFSRISSNDVPETIDADHAITNKRQLVWQAVNSLSDQSTLDVHEVALAEGAPFGTIRVSDECTLCHACTRLCPTMALSQSGSSDTQKLQFTEERCVQCGICQQGCPENAITLVPQLLLDASRRKQLQVLHEENIAACIECGASIMSQALLDSGFKHVKNHPLFQGNGAKAFKLCANYRIQAAALDEVLFPRESMHVI